MTADEGDDLSGAQRVKRLLRFEKDHGLFEISILGHRFWDYARYSVHERIQYFSRGVSDTQKTCFLTVGADAIVSCAHYVADIFRLKKKRYDVVVINTTGRLGLLDHKNVNVYVYPVVKQLSRSYNVLFLDIFGNVTKANYPCDVLRLRFLHVLYAFLSRVTRISAKDRAAIDAVRTKLQGEFSVPFDDFLKRDYLRQILFYRSFRNIFRRVAPRIVVFSDNGSMKAPTEAAHELGIATIDFQHCAISYQNFLYNYTGLGSSASDMAIPRYVFTFGDYWNSEVRSPSETVAVGWPYFDMKTEGLLAVNEAPHEKKSIVVLSDGEISREYLVGVATKLATSLPDFKIIYKLRPEEYGQWKERYPRDFGETANIEVVDSDDVSLYEYFSRCSYQVGINSTALYEGLAFNVITFILKVKDYGDVERLIDEGDVFLVTGVDEIVEKIVSKATPGHAVDRDSMFRPNSLRNVESAIDGLVRGGL